MVNLVKQDFIKNKKLYKKVEVSLTKILGKNCVIEHVGSTSIPDMFGKNIIDVLIGAENNFQFEKFAKILTNAGYYPSFKSKTDEYQFFASKQEETSSGDIHLHLVLKKTNRYNEFLILRDYLLSHPNEAEMYSNHKKQILANNKDRKQYKAIKSEYVTNLIIRAKNSL